MDNELPDSSAAPEGEEELHGKEYNIVDPDLNNGRGNVAMDKDRYTQKRLIIKVSLTEVMFIRRKDLSAATDQATLKVPRGAIPRLGSRLGSARLGTHASVDRIKTGDTQFSFPAEKLISTFACVCQPKLFLQVFCQFRLHLP